VVDPPWRMNSPYTAQPVDAFIVAQSSVALAVTALAATRRARPSASGWLLLAAVWWSVFVVVQGDLLGGLGIVLPPDHFHAALKAQGTLVTIAAALTMRPIRLVVALGMQVGLFKLTDFLQQSDLELAALHLLYAAVMVAVEARARVVDVAPPAPAAEAGPEPRAYLARDLRLGAVATLLAVLVAVFVLDSSIDSSDEWAYTFQAAVFAKGRAYAPAPPCSPAYQNFWVFETAGRQFSQYTPGWPLFMAPFALFRVVHLAAAFSLGLFVMGIARLTRRAARDSGFDERTVVASGTVAAVCATLSSTMLVNGGSRFGHVFVAALLAWAIEAACAAVDASKRGDARRQWGWSVVLGGFGTWLVVTRPGDGAAVALGLVLYSAYAVVRRRMAWRAVAGAVLSAGFMGGLGLVILRLQLGAWFQTGYSLNAVIHPWNRVSFSLPEAHEWRWGIPLATGSYCWWPMSPALGAGGLLFLRGKARRLGFMLATGTLGLLTFTSALSMGRGYDWGYGPRYVLASVVPMAVGAGLALGQLYAQARRAPPPGAGALSVAWPFVVACVAIGMGVVRIAPLVYPHNRASVQSLNELFREIKKQRVHHAVVFLPPGAGWRNEGLDHTQNLPITLYPEQDVIIAMEKTPQLAQCVRKTQQGRAFYRAFMTGGVTLRRE
jgi:hypothetical protein